ncbi:hypothetical protein [uncultured Erythrobacter sp.]|uniref:hypothetical protein n=1 Tax=uncultured Erythrobacter sp. TaxID=263913 RepID=UPI0026154563|nr:hypothetical protein [uncultured Erythrobacter sp.]
MAALADALAEESKSAALAERSRALMREYVARGELPSGSALRDHTAFVQSLQGVAEQADEASKDAGDQARWQVQTLAAADTRATRLEARLDAARRELTALEIKREGAASAAMARKLQTPSGKTR